MRGKQAEMLKKAQEDRDRLARQIENLQHQLAGMDRAIAAMGGETVPVEQVRVSRDRVRNMKDTVLGLIAGSDRGLSVIEVLEGALRHGTHLERNSVSSLLSRLKREDVLDMTDGRYFVKPKQQSERASVFN